MKYLTAFLLTTLALTMSVAAQQAQSAARVRTEIFASNSTSVVKGAPFSAEGISESVQTLADGNRILHSNTTRMFRDSEGRYRREGDSSPDSFGFTTSYNNGVSSFIFQDAISIFDPVSNTRYSLNPSNKTARLIPTLPRLTEGAMVLNGQTLPLNAQTLPPALKAQIETNAVKRVQPIAPLPALATFGGSEVILATPLSGKINGGKTESLGTRDFEGVLAEGSRTVTTIEAGAIGNERPIEIVYERWYSKELQMIVYSRHTDPRFGEQNYRLTNISRSEPDRSLFAPPADYKIVSDRSFSFSTTKQQ